jgi:Uncharacterized conserved protein containing a ferredoxin-like domain
MEKTAEALRKNNFWAQCADNASEALEVVESLLAEGDIVSCGGSMTLFEIGAIDLLRSEKYEFLDRYKEGLHRDEIEEIFKKTFYADVYLTSSNAITEDGELYNVDGTCNRIAAMLYGPKSVIVVAGYNKIVKDLDAAAQRVKQIAAPANALRLNVPTPCVKTGYCIDCKTDARICANYTTFTRQRVKDRMKVILVGEELGY